MLKVGRYRILLLTCFWVVKKARDLKDSKMSGCKLCFIVDLVLLRLPYQ